MSNIFDTMNHSYNCEYCLKIFEKTYKCGKCRLIRYCSAECQHKDWPNHQKRCSVKTENDIVKNKVLQSASTKIATTLFERYDKIFPVILTIGSLELLNGAHDETICSLLDKAYVQRITDTLHYVGAIKPNMAQGGFCIYTGVTKRGFEEVIDIINPHINKNLFLTTWDDSNKFVIVNMTDTNNMFLITL